MLSRILGWLGFKSREAPIKPSRRSPRPGSATAHLFEKRQTQPPPKPGSGAGKAGGFDPYNTGKFDRSASWERISKTQR